jgi:hypothetical protein
MPIARQRLGKHISEVTLSTVEGHSLLGKGPIKHAFLTTEDGVFRGVLAEEL